LGLLVHETAIHAHPRFHGHHPRALKPRDGTGRTTALARLRARLRSWSPSAVSLFTEACKYIPGGVNSPVRAFRGVGGEPIFFARAKDSRLWAADGREFIDYVGSWGPMILGHAHPSVIGVVQKTAENGLSFGAPTEIERVVA